MRRDGFDAWRAEKEGDIIAEGHTGVEGYGGSVVERARFITGTIRAHLRRQACDVHRHERDDLELPTDRLRAGRYHRPIP